MKPRGIKVKKAVGLALHQPWRAYVLLRDQARVALRNEDHALEEARHWSISRGQDKILNWQDHPFIRERNNIRVTGNPILNWLEYFIEKHMPGGIGKALNVGCGFGDLEKHVLSLGAEISFHSIDLSSEAIAKARARLKGAPIFFEVCDVNEASFEPESYNVVFFASSLHHVDNLERVLTEVEKALLPGGLLIFNEYVGPSKFQWEKDQLRVINDVLQSLYPRYAKDLRKGFGYKRRVYVPPVDGSGLDSPFEAIRSEEILPLVREKFDMVEDQPYGGALLHPLLDGIAGNFAMDREEDLEVLGRLCDLEMDLESSGLIGSDFHAAAARKRRGK